MVKFINIFLFVIWPRKSEKGSFLYFITTFEKVVKYLTCFEASIEGVLIKSTEMSFQKFNLVCNEYEVQIMTWQLQ